MAAPSIRVNGGTAGVKASVSATSAVTATLDSTDGVRQCTWSVLSTDETSSTASYTLTQSGSVGQNVAFTSLGAGTAMLLKVVINAGIDAQTGLASASTTSATVKVYVPTAAGKEVGCAGERYESDATFGSTGIINAGIRAIDEVSPGGIPVKIVKGVATTALPSNTRSGNVLTATANGAFPTLDSVVTIGVGDRFLVPNEGGGASHVNNGIYTLTTAGDGSNPWTATRAVDWNDSSELVQGTLIRVQQGTTYGGQSVVYRTAGATINVTAQEFSPDDVAPANAQYLCITGSALLSNETAIDAIASTVPFVSTTTTPVSLSRTDSATAATVNVATCIASSTGTTASGFGPSITMQAKQGSGSTETLGRLDCVWTDVTGSSEDSKWVLRSRAGGTAVTAAGGIAAEFSPTTVTLTALAGAATRLCTASTTGALSTVSGTAGLVTVAASGAPTVSNPAILVNGTVPANVSNGVDVTDMASTLYFASAAAQPVVGARADSAPQDDTSDVFDISVVPGAAADAGCGVGVTWTGTNDASSPIQYGRIAAVLTTPTAGAHATELRFYAAAAGASPLAASLTGAGVWTTVGAMQSDAGFDSETATTLPIGGNATRVDILSAVATGGTGAGVRIHNDAGIRTAGHLCEFGDDSTFAFKSGVDYRGVYDGPVLWATALKTSGYTAAVWDQVLCDPTTGAFQVTIPNGSTANKGKRIGVKNYGTSTNTITIDTSTPNGIQGGTATITTGWGYVELECVGADGWIIVSRVT